MPNDYTTYKACGDWLFWMHIAECGYVCYTPKLMNHFRMHDTNITLNHIKDGISSHEVLLVLKYLLSKGYMTKREMLKWRINRYQFHQYDYPLDSSELRRFKKEWGISPFIWLCIKYDHLIDKIIKIFQKMIV